MAHSPLATPSATREVLDRFGLAPNKSLGQHFLIDDNVVGRILAMAQLSKESVVVEVGPGIGTLTAALCREAGEVVAVERDSALLPALEALSEGCGHLRIVRADAVRVDLARLTTPDGPPDRMVANLPYAVAATVVLRFFEEMESLRSAVVMVQAEVADRMAASPGSKDYGSYTVKLQLRALPSGRFAVPRGCFMPPPRVDSAVLRLDRSDRPVPDALAALAGRLANSAFAQRRKTLRNSVLGTSGVDPAAFDRALEAAEIDGRRRAESLAVAEYVTLAGALRASGAEL